MTRSIGSAAVAALFVASVASAQSPLGNSQRPSRPPTQAPAGPIASGEQHNSPFTGCLYRADKDTGRSDDFILADAALAGARGQTAGLSTGTRYRITKLDDHRLSPLVGKKVEITGTIVVVDGGSGEGRALSKLEGESIREIAGTCPATPSDASAPAAPKP